MARKRYPGRALEQTLYNQYNGQMTDEEFIHELKNFVLGENWYIVDPVNSQQGNYILLIEILSRIDGRFKPPRGVFIR